MNAFCSRGRRLTLTCTLLLALVAGCSRSPGQTPPTSVEKPKTESDLARTTLSSDAVKSLGIKTEPAHNRPVQARLQLTGWIMIKQGNEVTVTAPVAGYVREAGEAKTATAAGLPAGQDQELLVLEPVLSPVEQIQLATLKRGVEGELAKAVESVLVARSELQRVQDLTREGVRQQQDFEQARARLKHAEEDQAAAVDKLKLFASSGNGPGPQLKPISIRSPRAGTILSVHASPGQYVPAAAPLVTVADLSELWLRVPVCESDLPFVDRTEPATALLTPTRANNMGPIRLRAVPLAAVPLVDTNRHTADLIYDLTPALRPAAAREPLAARDGAASIALVPARPAAARPFLAKDQMLTVFLPLGRQQEETVVPYAAVVFDAYAGAWIYLDQTTPNAKEHVYERRRVELGPSVESDVVIRPSLKSSERVVVAGAAALFSREFHKTPVTPDTPKMDVDDDD